MQEIEIFACPLPLSYGPFQKEMPPSHVYDPKVVYHHHTFDFMYPTLEFSMEESNSMEEFSALFDTMINVEKMWLLILSESDCCLQLIHKG